MAACGWVDAATADALGVSLAIFKGVSNFNDFVEEGAPTSNVVKVVSKAAEERGISPGTLGQAALLKLSE